MPCFGQHCTESIRLFGKPFEEVHKRLDESAGRPPFGMKHRRVRLHLDGTAVARKQWGDEAAAAQQHVISDLNMEGWTEDRPFPKYDRDYVRIGLFEKRAAVPGPVLGITAPAERKRLTRTARLSFFPFHAIPRAMEIGVGKTPS